MIDAVYIGAGFVFAYLVGSIPTAVWYGRSVHDIDVREHGSGNAGATNTLRVLGKRAGAIVLLLDLIKGAIATLAAWVLMKTGHVPADHYKLWELFFGLVAVTGHILPIFAGFKGGKGIATLMGMAIVLSPVAAVFCALVFFIVLFISQYVSLGSMLGSLTFPIVMLLIPRLNPNEPALIIFGFVIFVLVVYTHKKNIGRLLRGEENKTVLIRLRKK